jgi:hypothetical protein
MGKVRVMMIVLLATGMSTISFGQGLSEEQKARAIIQGDGFRCDEVVKVEQFEKARTIVALCENKQGAKGGQLYKITVDPSVRTGKNYRVEKVQ